MEKTNMREKDIYTSPQIEVIELETETSILAGSIPSIPGEAF